MKMIIDGKKRDASDNGIIEVYNPATQQLIDTVPNATPQDVELALDTARRGCMTWGKMSPDDRIKVLMNVANQLEKHTKELGELLCNELGRPYEQCVGEAAGVGDIFRSFAEKMKFSYGEILPSKETDVLMVKREPLGVVVCIAPFNFPLAMFAFKAASALAAGNSVIMKPATVTPLASIRMAEIILQAGMPAEALQIITGSGERIGDILSSSPKVNAISLTGSTEVGLRIANHASANLTRTFLELGGNDPLIILRDADLDLAIKETIAGRMYNAGQVCCGSKRIIVHRDIANDYVEKLAEELRKIKVTDPYSEDCSMGPLVSERAAKEVEKQVKHTIAQGAKCYLGGNRFNKTFFEPTILTDVTADMDVAKDMEIFGPVVPVIVFDDIDEAVAIANQTKYGLSGGVIGRDVKTAMSTALRLESGTTVVNGCGDYRTLHTPFGGHKMSGIGTEGLLLTLEEMMLTKCVAIKDIVF